VVTRYHDEELSFGAVKYDKGARTIDALVIMINKVSTCLIECAS
jgi:hypothetical protein